MRTEIPFLFVVLFTVFLKSTSAKPAESLSGLQSVDPTSELLSADVKREQRSPQFGLLDDYSDYSSEEDYVEPRHVLGRKHKLHKHHKPLGLIGGHGCRGHECGGWQPEYSGYHPGGQESGHGGGSFATASAGSGSGGGGHQGGHSEANAQSASFSFGPYTASFSVAQASSGHDRY